MLSIYDTQLHPDTLPAAAFAELKNAVDGLRSQYETLFSWYDGPLIQAMRDGDYILIDEISLAEDSVLERLNSVLEPARTLVLAEKGGVAVEELVAHANFRIIATMNPGGDFGKKELSPAMRYGTAPSALSACMGFQLCSAHWYGADCSC